MGLTQTPAVHTRRKSRWAPSDVDMSVKRAAITARGCPTPIAAFHDGEVVGMVKSEAHGKWTDFVPMTPKMWATVGGYADLRTAFSQGHGFRAYFRRETVNWTLNDAYADLWPLAGTGQVSGNGGTYTGTANTARQLDNTSPGALWLGSTRPDVGESRYLVGWELSNTGSNLARQLILYDRVLTYESVAITAATTTFTNTLAAQRYISSGDPGLMVTATCQTGTGATASNMTGMTFTDNKGNTGVSQVTGITQSIITGTTTPSNTIASEVMIPSNTSRAPIPWLPLGGTVEGVRKIESVTFDTANTGTLCFVLSRPLGTLWLHGASINNFLDLTKSMFQLSKVFDTACLSFFMHQSSSNGGSFQGQLSFAYK